MPKTTLIPNQIEVNNITLNYIKEGSGNPLILLHGNGEDYSIFDVLIEKLKNDFTIYAIDSRNHGKSSKTDDFGYETMAKDITEFIEKLGLENVSIVGFSDGAIVALTMELAQTNTFGKMVLLGVNLKPTDFKKENYDYLIEEYAKTKDPFIKMMLDQPNIELDSLKNISTPTLLIAAEDDLYNSQLYENMIDVIPNARLEIMEGHDHASYIINEDIIYPYLKEFL